MIFVTIAVFKLLLKRMKNQHGGEKPFRKTHTCSSFNKEAVPMIYL